MKTMLACAVMAWTCQGAVAAGMPGEGPKSDQQPRRVVTGASAESRTPTPALQQQVIDASPVEVPAATGAGTEEMPTCKATGPCTVRYSVVVFEDKKGEKKVVKIYTHTRTALDAPLTVAVAGLCEWDAVPGNDPNDLRLWLGGRMLSALKPTIANTEQNYLNFELTLMPEDREQWVSILAEARRVADHAVPVSVGMKNSTQPFESDVYVVFRVFPPYIWVIALVLGVFGVGLVALGVRSNLLRGAVIAVAPARPDRLPFSLARVQMAWWFLLVVGTFVYIWLITGSYDTLTASVLGLIGISGATGLAAIFVDREKVNEAAARRTELELRLANLEMRTSELASSNAPVDSPASIELHNKRLEIGEARSQLSRLPARPDAPKSRGFVLDILSDADGVSFHRFQMVVWSVLLAIVFVEQVYRHLTMPEFDATLLGLMGISSGTYVGFKFPTAPK